MNTNLAETVPDAMNLGWRPRRSTRIQLIVKGFLSLWLITSGSATRDATVAEERSLGFLTPPFQRFEVRKQHQSLMSSPPKSFAHITSGKADMTVAAQTLYDLRGFHIPLGGAQETQQYLRNQRPLSPQPLTLRQSPLVFPSFFQPQNPLPPRYYLEDVKPEPESNPRLLGPNPTNFRPSLPDLGHSTTEDTFKPFNPVGIGGEKEVSLAKPGSNEEQRYIYVYDDPDYEVEVRRQPKAQEPKPPTVSPGTQETPIQKYQLYDENRSNTGQVQPNNNVPFSGFVDDHTSSFIPGQHFTSGPNVEIIPSSERKPPIDSPNTVRATLKLAVPNNQPYEEFTVSPNFDLNTELKQGHHLTELEHGPGDELELFGQPYKFEPVPKKLELVTKPTPTLRQESDDVVYESQPILNPNRYLQPYQQEEENVNFEDMDHGNVLHEEITKTTVRPAATTTTSTTTTTKPPPSSTVRSRGKFPPYPGRSMATTTTTTPAPTVFRSRPRMTRTRSTTTSTTVSPPVALDYYEAPEPNQRVENHNSIEQDQPNLNPETVFTQQVRNRGSRHRGRDRDRGQQRSQVQSPLANRDNRPMRQKVRGQPTVEPTLEQKPSLQVPTRTRLNTPPRSHGRQVAGIPEFTDVPRPEVLSPATLHRPRKEPLSPGSPTPNHQNRHGGKPLYVTGKMLEKEGGLYAGFPIRPEQHAYAYGPLQFVPISLAPEFEPALVPLPVPNPPPVRHRDRVQHQRQQQRLQHHHQSDPRRPKQQFGDNQSEGRRSTQKFVHNQSEARRPPQQFPDHQSDIRRPLPQFSEHQSEVRKPPQHFIDNQSELRRLPQQFVDNQSEARRPQDSFSDTQSEVRRPPQQFPDYQSEARKSPHQFPAHQSEANRPPQQFPDHQSESSKLPQQFVDNQSEIIRHPQQFSDHQSEIRRPHPKLSDNQSEVRRAPQHFPDNQSQARRIPQQFLDNQPEARSPPEQFLDNQSEARRPPQQFPDHQSEVSRPLHNIVDNQSELRTPPNHQSELRRPPPTVPVPRPQEILTNAIPSPSTNVGSSVSIPVTKTRTRHRLMDAVRKRRVKPDSATALESNEPDSKLRHQPTPSILQGIQPTPFTPPVRETSAPSQQIELPSTPKPNPLKGRPLKRIRIPGLFTTTTTEEPRATPKFRARPRFLRPVKEKEVEPIATQSVQFSRKPTSHPQRFSSQYTDDSISVPQPNPTVPQSSAEDEPEPTQFALPPSLPKKRPSVKFKKPKPSPEILTVSPSTVAPVVVQPLIVKELHPNLPTSILLQPKDVIQNRKPARRIPPGSASDRLKALQERRRKLFKNRASPTEPTEEEAESGQDYDGEVQEPQASNSEQIQSKREIRVVTGQNRNRTTLSIRPVAVQLTPPITTTVRPDTQFHLFWQSIEPTTTTPPATVAAPVIQFDSYIQDDKNPLNSKLNSPFNVFRLSNERPTLPLEAEFFQPFATSTARSGSKIYKL